MEKSELVKKSINGDVQAFERLVKDESEKLYKTAILYVRNKEDALDILQESIYKAFISMNQLKQPEYFNTWLTRILIHTSYDFLRKRKKIVLDENVMHEVSEVNDQDIEGRIDLLNAVTKLNKNYQTVIILFYYHDLPINQIAETMGTPQNTVKTYLRRAKMELKNLIEGVRNCEKRAFR
ncbi:sigma-70 family RNA polymerase sigma factor [Virgibacillus kekensis]|uniref:Sigma-70 family RNA polymerase sigma factor n=1 Tax=Virgibacillus kekensis TaxID=202261 RepID=A0ABV9DMQ0_9BACI